MEGKNLLMKKARELGRELKETEEYQELEKISQKLREDAEVQQLIQDIQDAQKQIEFSRYSGVGPTPEQMEDLSQKKEILHTNITVRAYMKAQDNFNFMMKKVNEAIAEGMGSSEAKDD